MVDAAKPKVITQRGIVGFFDILGYQSFLENNEASEAVIGVLNALLGMPAKARQMCLCVSDDEELWKRFFSQIHPLIFSDTILLSIPFDSKDDELSKKAKWFALLLQTMVLQRQLFDFGLPIRGAVAVGDYVFQQSCFAGRPIIEAYKTAQDLDLAAVVLTDGAYSELSAFLCDKTFRDVIEPILKDYAIPLKNSQSKRFKTVDFTWFGNPNLKNFREDATKLVAECFRRHNKHIPAKAHTKLENTEKLIRFLTSQPFWESDNPD